MFSVLIMASGIRCDANKNEIDLLWMDAGLKDKYFTSYSRGLNLTETYRGSHRRKK